MMREDFNKFRKAILTDLDTKYFFDFYDTDKDYYLPFAKVRKNNTTFNEKVSKNYDNHKGIFVDIFPYDYNDDNFKRCFIKASIIQILSDTVLLKKKLTRVKDCRHSFLSGVFCIFSSCFILRFIDFLSQNFNGSKKNKTHIVCFNSMVNIGKEYFVKGDIFPLKKVKFENYTYNGLNDNDKYLTMQYGDYMKLPPKEKRVNHNTVDISFTEGKELFNRK